MIGLRSGLFFHRDVLRKAEPITLDSDIYIGESISKHLRKQGKPTILPYAITSSSADFRKYGVARTLFVDALCVGLYLCGTRDSTIRDIYVRLRVRLLEIDFLWSVVDHAYCGKSTGLTNSSPVS